MKDSTNRCNAAASQLREAAKLLDQIEHKLVNDQELQGVLLECCTEGEPSDIGPLSDLSGGSSQLKRCAEAIEGLLSRESCAEALARKVCGHEYGPEESDDAPFPQAPEERNDVPAGECYVSCGKPRMLCHTVYVVFPSPHKCAPSVDFLGDIRRYREWKESFTLSVEEMANKMETFFSDGWSLDKGPSGEFKFAHPEVWNVDDAVKRLQALGYTGADVGSSHDAPEIEAKFHNDREFPF